MRTAHAAQLIFSLACTSAPQTDGLAPPESPDAACVANSCGDCYPTTNLGTGVGNVVADFCFDGAPGFCFVDFYDPEACIPIKLVHVVVVAGWSTGSTEVTDFITGSNASGSNPSHVSWASELMTLGVRFIVVLDDGNVTGTGATLADLQSWASEHTGTPVAMGIDPGNRNLGIFFDAAAVPFNLDIDARRMTVMASSVGIDTSLDASIKALLANMN